MSPNHHPENAYDDHAAVAEVVDLGEHRALIGGLWEEVGELQLQFLVSHGLKPSDHLIDVGCGSLRGGVKFAAFLEPHHYWGIDSNPALLEAGYNIEVPAAGISDRVRRESLICSEAFEFHQFNREFEVAIAQSLFSHLSANRIRLCLHRLAPVIKPGGRFFATYFEAPEHFAFDHPCDHPNGVTTWSFKDPFHYRLSDFEQFCVGTSWRLVWTGDWGHPRDQKMAILERLPETLSGVSTETNRELDVARSRARGAVTHQIKATRPAAEKGP